MKKVDWQRKVLESQLKEKVDWRRKFIKKSYSKNHAPCNYAKSRKIEKSFMKRLLLLCPCFNFVPLPPNQFKPNYNEHKREHFFSVWRKAFLLCRHFSIYKGVSVFLGKLSFVCSTNDLLYWGMARWDQIFNHLIPHVRHCSECSLFYYMRRLTGRNLHPLPIQCKPTCTVKKLPPQKSYMAVPFKEWSAQYRNDCCWWFVNISHF